LAGAWSEEVNCSLTGSACSIAAGGPVCTGTSTCTPYSADTFICVSATTTALVECSGGVQVGDVDCTDPFPGTGSTASGVCHDYGAAIGPSCLMPLGSACSDATGVSINIFGCGLAATGLSASMACDQIAGVCVNATTTCTTTPYCDNNLLAISCTNWGLVTQPLVDDCASPVIEPATGGHGPGVCGSTSNYTTCVVPSGSKCQDVWFTPFACGTINAGTGTVSRHMGCDLVDGCVSTTTTCDSSAFQQYCDGTRLVVGCNDWSGGGGLSDALAKAAANFFNVARAAFA